MSEKLFLIALVIVVWLFAVFAVRESASATVNECDCAAATTTVAAAISQLRDTLNWGLFMIVAILIFRTIRDKW